MLDARGHTSDKPVKRGTVKRAGHRLVVVHAPHPAVVRADISRALCTGTKSSGEVGGSGYLGRPARNRTEDGRRGEQMTVVVVQAR